MAPTLKGFSREYLASLFSYDPDTGLITRLVSRGYQALAGDVIGCLHSAGYLFTYLDGKHLYVHRLAYFLHAGDVPPKLDHHDGDKRNNKFSNLRPATSAQNNRNVPLTKNNTSGFKGVNYDRARGKFRAKVQVAKRRIHLGYFDTAEAAALAYDIAAVSAAGEFALTNQNMGLLKECE